MKPADVLLFKDGMLLLDERTMEDCEFTTTASDYEAHEVLWTKVVRHSYLPDDGYDAAGGRFRRECLCRCVSHRTLSTSSRSRWKKLLLSS